MVPLNSTSPSEKRTQTPYAWLSNATASSENEAPPVAIELPDHIKTATLP
jgi:hypothetical protein